MKKLAFQVNMRKKMPFELFYTLNSEFVYQNIKTFLRIELELQLIILTQMTK